MDSMTPRQIVAELDKYIIGQDEAKKAVALAVRNRWRRLRLTGELREEVIPKNIIMIGPTGVGKTEIARRMAALAGAPFLKVEASKYTEVGYVGRSVETMVRDLAKTAVSMIEKEVSQQVEDVAALNAEKELFRAYMKSNPLGESTTVEVTGTEESYRSAKDRVKRQLHEGKLDDQTVEVEVNEPIVPPIGVISNANLDDLGIDLGEIMSSLSSGMQQRMGGEGRHTTKKMTVRAAREMLIKQETEKLIDREAIVREALFRTQDLGIIFIDEIDKVCGSYAQTSSGPDVSREGVQRDLLPIVEGTMVNTPFGMVRTDHILFIAAGAFHITKPSELIPELQGRFPIRVELNSLGRAEFVQILRLPKNSLTRQYEALLATEGVTLAFEDEAIDEIAEVAERVNQKDQNIGARRLHTIMEKVLEDISFTAPEQPGTTVAVTRALVREKIASIVKDENLTKYIL
ncbi:MAG: ATP-dependent protease ATPase subunit HslU [Verrucomicrobia bacterium]|nr:ATP-dependent protease ATPase subunit HslU [Verrucomicrobiota bacterium]